MAAAQGPGAGRGAGQLTAPPRPTPILETPRLRLRPRRGDDAVALHAPLSDPELMRYWSSPPQPSLAATRVYLARDAGPGWRCWVIADPASDAALGWVSVGAKRQGGVSEIGYLLARSAHGRGLAGEAVAAVLDQLFDGEGERRVFADTDPDNAASNALLERLGFTLEGRLRGEWETHIGVRDSLIWGVLADEWRERRMSR